MAPRTHAQILAQQEGAFVQAELKRVEQAQAVIRRELKKKEQQPQLPVRTAQQPSRPKTPGSFALTPSVLSSADDDADADDDDDASDTTQLARYKLENAYTDSAVTQPAPALAPCAELDPCYPLLDRIREALDTSDSGEALGCCITLMGHLRQEMVLQAVYLESVAARRAVDLSNAYGAMERAGLAVPTQAADLGAEVYSSTEATDDEGDEDEEDDDDTTKVVKE